MYRNIRSLLTLAAIAFLSLSVLSYAFVPVPQVEAHMMGHMGFHNFHHSFFHHNVLLHHHFFFHHFYYYPYYYYPYYYGYGSNYGTGCNQTGSTGYGGAGGYGGYGGMGYGGYGGYGGASSGCTNTVTVGTNLPQGVASGGGSYQYTAGSTVQLKAAPTIDGGSGVRYVFDHWSGDYTGTSTSGSMKVDSDKTVTANYKTQYFIGMSASPGGVVDMSSEQGWYDAGTDMTMNAPETVSAGEGVRYVFDSVMLDSFKETTPAMTIHVDKPHTVAVNYVKQYYLKVNSDKASVSGEGWYNEGSQAILQAPVSVPAGFGTSYRFAGWSGDVSSGSPSATVLMDGSKTVTANWQIDRTGLYLAIAGILGLAAVAGVALKRRNAPVGFLTGANTVGFAPRAASTCRGCQASIPVNSKFCPDCGRAQT